jgi:uroporphyrinogen III methyltransferase/synthase
MYERLRGLGAEVIPMPTIATRPAQSDAAWEQFPDRATAADCWLVLTSENGVRYFMDQFIERFRDLRKLAGFKIAAVGFGTARALNKYHLQPDFIPTTATTVALAQELVAHEHLKNSVVVRVRGNLADDRVETILTEAGDDVRPLATYETYFPTWPEHMKQDLLERPPDVITFTSGSSADGFMANLSPSELPAFADSVVVSIGPSTSQTVTSHGLKVSVEATTHSVPGVIDSLLQYYSRKEQAE